VSEIVEVEDQEVCHSRESGNPSSISVDWPFPILEVKKNLIFIKKEEKPQKGILSYPKGHFQIISDSGDFRFWIPNCRQGKT